MENTQSTIISYCPACEHIAIHLITGTGPVCKTCLARAGASVRPLTPDEKDGGARFEHIVNAGIDY